MTTNPKPLTDVTAYERDYLRLIRQHGQPAPANKRLDIQVPVADDGNSDCWTHAWEVARSLQARGVAAAYVEGVCVRPGANGPSFHAWVEEHNLLTGRTLVECTPGYEQATRYVGITVDSTPGGLVEEITSDWQVRASVIQAALAGGGTPAQVLDAVRPKSRG